jgi:MFS family permease
MKGEWAGVRGESFDFRGSLLYGLALFSIIYGFSHLPSAVGVGLLLVGISTLVGFILWEIRVPNPVLDIRLFRHNRVFLFSNLATLVHYCATFGVGFLLSLYLQYIKLLSPWHAGLVLVAQPAMQALISPFAGRLSDKVEPQFVASAGMAFTSIGLICLTFLHPETGLGRIIFFLLFLGFGFGLFSSPNTNAVMSSIEGKYYGVASGIVGTMRLLGQMFSMGIVTLIFTLFLGKIHITPASLVIFLRGTRLAFLIFAFLCLLGFFASLARGKIHRFPK